MGPCTRPSPSCPLSPTWRLPSRSTTSLPTTGPPALRSPPLRPPPPTMSSPAHHLHHRLLLRQPLLVPLEAAHVRLLQRRRGPPRDLRRQARLPRLLRPRLRFRLRQAGADGLLPGAAYLHRSPHREALRRLSVLMHK